MALSNVNQIPVGTLSATPGVTVWYCKISHITRAIFSKPNYHNSRPLVNEIFKKNDFRNGFFNTEEIRMANGFKAFKKQLEWLCGRFLAKQLIHSTVLPELPLEHITLKYMNEGAPYLPEAPGISVSLSHSYGYAAAAVCTDTQKKIGIDLEKIRKKPDAAFLKTAFTQREITHLGTDAESIFKNWTVKEAFLKFIRKGFNESLHKVEVIGNTVFHHQKKIHLKVTSIKVDTAYILSLVVG